MLGDITSVDSIYIVCGYTDMRKSIDGLCTIIPVINRPIRYVYGVTDLSVLNVDPDLPLNILVRVRILGAAIT